LASPALLLIALLDLILHKDQGRGMHRFASVGILSCAHLMAGKSDGTVLCVAVIALASVLNVSETNSAEPV